MMHSMKGYKRMILCPIENCQSRCRSVETLEGHLLQKHIKYHIVKALIKAIDHPILIPTLPTLTEKDLSST